jgi:hypothetical protein
VTPEGVRFCSRGFGADRSAGTAQAASRPLAAGGAGSGLARHGRRCTDGSAAVPPRSERRRSAATECTPGAGASRGVGRPRARCRARGPIHGRMEKAMNPMMGNDRHAHKPLLWTSADKPVADALTRARDLHSRWGEAQALAREAQERVAQAARDGQRERAEALAVGKARPRPTRPQRGRGRGGRRSRPGACARRRLHARPCRGARPGRPACRELAAGGRAGSWSRRPRSYSTRSTRPRPCTTIGLRRGSRCCSPPPPR